MNLDREIQRATDIGKANQKVIELARNWCAHLTVESMGGVGMVEEATGLPIGARRFRCSYASAGGFAGMNLEVLALEFYDRNCVGCEYRKPVRLPNLNQLVGKRDSEAQQRDERAQLATKEEAKKINLRVANRRALRKDSDSSRNGILDILDRLDRDPSEENCRVLEEAAIAAADKFDTVIEDALIELVDAGGHNRIKTALEVLFKVSEDKTNVTGLALKALQRFEALDTAGDIVAQGIDASHAPLIADTITGLACLASPIGPMGFGERIPGNPQPLLVVYHSFPDIVTDGIHQLLKTAESHFRVNAFHSIEAIIKEDPDFARKVAEAVIASIGLPDEFSDEVRIESAISRTLAMMLNASPNEIDPLIHANIACAGEDTKVILFDSYTWLLRQSHFGKTEYPDEYADELAFKRVVEVLAERPHDKRFQHAALFVRDSSNYHPALVESHVNILIGAAALIASDLEVPYSILTDPDPHPLKAIEAQTRATELNIALNAIVASVGDVASRQLQSVGGEVMQIFGDLDETHERLKASIVKILGTIGKSHDGLTLVLPSLYSAMMDRSQLIRAAAASAYGDLAQNAPEDMPLLVHESFLVLLRDPYVVVHKAALRALQKVRLPEQLKVEALTGVALLINVYSMTNDEDETLSDCIKQFMILMNQIGTLQATTVDAIVTTVSQMAPHVAVNLIRYHGRTLRKGQGYADLIVRLLADPESDDWDLETLVKELAEFSDNEIRRLADEIKTAAIVCRSRGEDMTDDFIEILVIAGAWSAAAEVASHATESFEDTIWERPGKLRAKARQAATELELATANGVMDDILQCVSRWREIQREIEEDDSANEEKRSTIFGIRLPDSSD